MAEKWKYKWKTTKRQRGKISETHFEKKIYKKGLLNGSIVKDKN